MCWRKTGYEPPERRPLAFVPSPPCSSDSSESPQLNHRMRFRADIINQRTFSSLITSLAPLSKIATLKLKADAVHLICAAEGNQVQVWS